MIDLSVFIPLLIGCVVCCGVGICAGYVVGKALTVKDYQERLQALIQHHNECDTKRIVEMHTLRAKLEKFNYRTQPRGNNGKFQKRG